MQRRNITHEQVLQVIRSAEPFPYNQEGVQHLGYYDSATRLFVAVADRVVVTVFRTRPSYVEGLRRRDL